MSAFRILHLIVMMFRLFFSLIFVPGTTIHFARSTLQDLMGPYAAEKCDNRSWFEDLNR